MRNLLDAVRILNLKWRNYPSMRKIVFDIETCCFPFEELSESQQEYILRYAEKERDMDVRIQKKEDAVRYLNLYPFTAKVIAIGILDVLKRKDLFIMKVRRKKNSSQMMG
jgi:hypothetical protein